MRVRMTILVLAGLVGCEACEGGNGKSSSKASSTKSGPSGKSGSSSEPGSSAPDIELYPALKAGGDGGVDLMNAEWGYISKDGEMVIEPRFSYAEPFAADVAWAQTTEKKGIRSVGRWGLIDKNGEWVKKPTYQEVGTFRNGYAWAKRKVGMGLGNDSKEPSTGFVDKTGSIAIPLDTGDDENDYAGEIGDNGLIPFIPMQGAEGAKSRSSRDPYGYANEQGEMAISPRFSYAGRFSEGLAPVSPTDKNKLGYIDAEGQMQIEPQFTRGKPFSDGLAVVATKEGYGAIDDKGEWVIEPKYGRLESFSEGLAAFKKPEGDKWGYIDREGNVAIEPRFVVAKAFEGPHAVVAQTKDGEEDDFRNRRYGLIDKDGSWVLDPKYKKVEITVPDGSLFYAQKVPKDGASTIGGYVDRNGKWVYGPVDGPWNTKLMSSQGF